MEQRTPVAPFQFLRSNPIESSSRKEKGMHKGNCEFNGSGREYLGLFVIHLFLLCVVTLGIYSPWAWVRLLKLKASHTLINGKQVTFTGNGKELLLIGLACGLLTIITLGIYSPWAICWILKWKARNTLVDGKPSEFVGTGGRLFVFYLIHLVILPILTLGIYYLYGMYRFYAWKEEHTKYGGERTSFGAGLWGLIQIFLLSSLIWLVLPVIAQFLSLPSLDLAALIIFILLAPWFMCMFFSWQIKGLAVGDDEGIEHFPTVKTNFLWVVIFILIGLFTLVAVGLYVKSQFDRQITEVGELAQIFGMKAKEAKRTDSIRAPVKRPPRAVTPRPGTKVPQKEVAPRKTPEPKPAKASPAKDAFDKPPVSVPPTPSEKPALNSLEYDREIRKFDDLIRVDTRNAVAYYNRGLLYGRKGELEKAEKDFSRAIEINNRIGDAYYNRGLVFVRMKKYDLAVKDFDVAIDLDSTAVDAYCNRGNANFQLGKADLAIGDYNKAMEIKPNDPDLYYNRGIAYLSKGLKSKAQADFEKAAELERTLVSKIAIRKEAVSKKEEVSKEKCDFDRIDITNVPVAPFLDEVKNKIDVSQHPTYRNMPRGKGNYRNTVDPFYFKRDRGKVPSYGFRQFTTSRDMMDIINWYKKAASPGTCETKGAFGQGGGSYSNGPFDNSAANFGVNNGRNFIVITAMKAPGEDKTTVYVFHYRTAPPPAKPVPQATVTDLKAGMLVEVKEGPG